MPFDEFQNGAIEVIPGAFYCTFVSSTSAVSSSATAAANVAYSVDHDLLYEPFYADFGPLNLGKAYRFCELTCKLLQDAQRQGKRLYVWTGPNQQHKANTAVLVGMFQVLLMGRSAEEAYRVVAPLQPCPPFRDASCGISTFHLTVQHCIHGTARARDAGFLKAGNGAWHLDVAEYQHYEQVEHGDLNWILPGKLVAFSGPAQSPNEYVGFRAMTPEDYWSYFRSKKVNAVVRLNKKIYERNRFLDGGFKHHELYFPDGSCPSEQLLLRWLELAESEPGCLAVHCKAGLGRTGVLICCYIMKHYRFTAEEVIGYIRICRPGSVIGPQQNFLMQMQPLMWAEGDKYRMMSGRASPPALAWDVTPTTCIRLPSLLLGPSTPVKAAGAATSMDIDSPLGRREYVGPLTRSMHGMSVMMPERTAAGAMPSEAAAAASSEAAYCSSSSSSSRQRVGGSGSGAERAAALAAAYYNTPSSLTRPPSSTMSQRAAAETPLNSSMGKGGAAYTSAYAPLLSGAVLTGKQLNISPDRPGSAGLRAAAPTAAASGSTLLSSFNSAANSLLQGVSSLRGTQSMRESAARQPGEGFGQGSQSSEAGWRASAAASSLSGIGSLSGSYGAPAPLAGSNNKATVARVLAPNGQPRKVPMLAAPLGPSQPPVIPSAKMSGVPNSSLPLWQQQ